ncbi:MAG: acetylxylan esterase [Armatimonadia bacterium]
MNKAKTSNQLLQVFTDGRATIDRRLTTPRTLDDVFTFPRYKTLAEWEHTAADIRQHLLACTGLLPMPDKCPLNPRFLGRFERDGYSVEKVLLETWPGFFLGGSLYRPLGKSGPFPAIINPHGHWARGRLHNDPDLGSLPGRFINLALQGHVAFAYDMIGYNDTFQLPHDFLGDREALWGISLLGLQLWNSIRAVDFVESLPEVDKKRLGCTGASGGGSQTFLLTAVEPRIAASLPAVMVSAHMQGGCVCENAPSLRLRYSNVQIAACTAPRPLHLIACTNDWTKNMATDEFPAIQSIYRLYGAEDNVSFFIQEANHNYNYASRQSCYQFFGKHFLGENDPEKLREQPFTVESDNDLLALPDKRPAKGALGQAAIMRSLEGAALNQWFAWEPKDKPSLKRFRDTFGAVLQQTMSIALPAANELAIKRLGVIQGDNYTAERMLLGRKGEGDAVPALLFTPLRNKARRPATVLVHEYGKAALMAEGLQTPGALVKGLLEAGHAVLTLDPLLCGEYNAQAGMVTRRNRDVRLFNTYNRPDVVEKAQDILTAVAAVTSLAGASQVNVAGLGEAGLWCLLAGAAAPQAISRMAADLASFDPATDAEFLSRLNVPHLRRAGDLAAATALFAPRPLLVHNLCPDFDVPALRGMYRAAGNSQALTTKRQPASPKAILSWLLTKPSR